MPSSKFVLTVPIDASGVDDAKGEVKVALLDGAGKVVQSQVVSLDAKKQASAKFTTDQPQSIARVVVGPGHADDEMLPKVQTIGTNVPARTLVSKRELALPPIVISPYFWQLWWRWCRDFTIHGRVVCPDGSPVPGAQVCAYDVDWFGIWMNKQLIGCTYTDANGAFQLKFRWCCGWWPWWWWRLREWEIDLPLATKILGNLPAEAKGRRVLPQPGPVPDLRFFEALVQPLEPRPALPQPALSLEPTEASISSFIDRAEKLRPAMQKILPQLPGITWPWEPWLPWFDCNPDVIFKVKQDCGNGLVTIVDQTYSQVHPNIPTDYGVVLTANDKACCRPKDHHVCGDSDCLILTHACGFERARVGQDVSPAGIALAGFANPGNGATDGAAADRPFAGNIVVEGTAECMGPDAEYYEVQYSQYDPNFHTWSSYAPVPAASLGGFTRTYLEFISGNPPVWHHPIVGPTPVGGKLVYESRLHYEATHPWLCMVNCEVLFVWVTDTAHWADGLYKLRVQPYKLVGSALQPVNLNSCGENAPSEFALRLDNRPLPDPLHPASSPSHPCGGGVHLCSVQPDCDVQDVRLHHAGGATEHVDACGLYEFGKHDWLEIDILVSDVDAHLASYSLITTFGENDSRDLLTGGATITDVTADYVGPDYKLAIAQGATAPNWTGGVVTVTIPESAMCEKFPYSCCYQLELRVYKRTIDSCRQEFTHNNLAEYSFFLSNKADCK